MSQPESREEQFRRAFNDRDNWEIQRRKFVWEPGDIEIIAPDEKQPEDEEQPESAE